ncbi:helix-turn-helix transcriptional regulator [Streptomyces sp. R302]|uniref:LuxR C-terminal-related transcriptional regulator n=1 Tax=unclassified Streptomyces TaxID=2593676 RepID=UPI00145E4A79|nr:MULTISPECIES: LuxR C-terminal-related transcriptional regulator [unclassified Streptomyces]NML52127.1 helix-turn-helix transcriptional regulator [Streptomyces sp. R301]NML82407.1 helix-turn-helix transcriptional regulator [Streptomyces sp. R302]
MDVTTLNAAYEILRRPLDGVLAQLSATLAPVVPHLGAAELSTHCAHSPFKTAGDAADGLTPADLAPLLAAGVPGEPWQGTVRLGGRPRPVLAVTSDATARRSLLVLLRADGAAPAGPDGLALAQALWDLVTSHLDRFAVEAMPGALARSRTAADTRARVIAELTTSHAAAVSGVLSVLRSRKLDDTAARAAATDLAASALLEIRSVRQRDRAVAEESARAAFGRLADELRTVFRHHPARLELGPPDSDVSLPADLAHSARAIVRALLPIVLDQEGVGRVHVGWRLTEQELLATVRDDGPGALAACDVGAGTVRDRLDVLGGRIELETVPGWGTTMTAVLPLATPDAPAGAAHPLATLGERETEVLRHLALGHRNRHIAGELHISESTVKFHVANILGKLGVASRGEAAALFHAAA